MIINLPRFLRAQRPTWTELEVMLESLSKDPYRTLSLEEARRFHLLYQKVAADLGRVSTFASEPALRRYLESLTARAYAEIHESRSKQKRFRPFHWFFVQFPATFRRHFGAFALSSAIVLVAALFGGFATALDVDAKDALLPGQFSHLSGDPTKRVADEEAAQEDRLSGHHTQFASVLMTNNVRVSILTLALGATYGIGTMISLFYNGVILGMIAVDYLRAGQWEFLLGWLLPHGVIEIPAILIAGQAGLLLGKALLGRGDRASLAERLRAVSGDLFTLVGGFSVMLVWAGIVESFLSQYHQPVLPYWEKITFGFVELIGLLWLLTNRRAIWGKEEKP